MTKRRLCGRNDKGLDPRVKPEGDIKEGGIKEGVSGLTGSIPTKFRFTSLTLVCEIKSHCVSSEKAQSCAFSFGRLGLFFQRHPRTVFFYVILGRGGASDPRIQDKAVCFFGSSGQAFHAARG